jgi:hypothetical protein
MDGKYKMPVRGCCAVGVFAEKVLSVIVQPLRNPEVEFALIFPLAILQIDEV